MNKNKLFYFILFSLVLIPLTAPAFAEKIVYSTSIPTWYSYNCSSLLPSSWTQTNPDANIWKYFSFYDGNCYATIQTFNLEDLTNLENTTSISLSIDTKGLVLTNQTANTDYQVNCYIYYFGNVGAGSGIDLSVTPTSMISPFDCTGSNNEVIESTLNFSVAQNATLTQAIQAGNFSQSFMIFPNFTSSLRSSWDSNGYDYAIGKFAHELTIIGDGFNCVTIEASNMCNIINEPWEAFKKALGEDYIGEWFYVLVFLPLPFAVFLITRNGAYAGFVCLPILLTINTVLQEVKEISWSLILIAGAFGFYEIIRKKIHE